MCRFTANSKDDHPSFDNEVNGSSLIRFFANGISGALHSEGSRSKINWRVFGNHALLYFFLRFIVIYFFAVPWLGDSIEFLCSVM